MIIKIKNIEHKETKIQVQKGDTIGTVIEKIKAKGDSDFRGVSDLILKGDKMDKEKTLDEYGINNTTTLICVGCINKGYRAEESYKDSGFNGQTTTGFLIDDLINRMLENPAITKIIQTVKDTSEIKVPKIDVGATRPASVVAGIRSGKKSKKKRKVKRKTTRKKRRRKVKTNHKQMGGAEEGPPRLRRGGQPLLLEFKKLSSQWMKEYSPVSGGPDWISKQTSTYLIQNLRIEHAAVPEKGPKNLLLALRRNDASDVVRLLTDKMNEEDLSHFNSTISKANKSLKEIIQHESTTGLFERVIWWLWTLSLGLYTNIRKDPMGYPKITSFLSDICKGHTHDVGITAHRDEPGYLYRGVCWRNWLSSFWLKDQGVLHFNDKWASNVNCGVHELKVSRSPFLESGFALYEESFVATSSDIKAATTMLAEDDPEETNIIFRIKGSIDVTEVMDGGECTNLVIHVSPIIPTSSPDFWEYSAYPSEKEYLLDGGLFISACVSVPQPRRSPTPCKWQVVDEPGEIPKHRMYDLYYIPKEKINIYIKARFIGLLVDQLNASGVGGTSMRKNLISEIDIDLLTTIANGYIKAKHRSTNRQLYPADKMALDAGNLLSEQANIWTFKKSLITLNGHGTFAEEKFVLPEGIQVLVPHASGTSHNYTTENRVDVSYEQILYNQGAINYEDQSGTISGWRLYQPGDEINNMIFHRLEDTPACNELYSMHDDIKEEQDTDDDGDLSWYLIYAVDEVQGVFVPLTITEGHAKSPLKKMKIKICNRGVSLEEICTNLKKRVRSLKDHLPLLSPGADDETIRLVIFTCNSKPPSGDVVPDNLVLTQQGPHLYDQFKILTQEPEPEPDPEPDAESAGEPDAEPDAEPAGEDDPEMLSQLSVLQPEISEMKQGLGAAEPEPGSEYDSVELSFRFGHNYTAPTGNIIAVFDEVKCDVNGKGSIWEAITSAYEKKYGSQPSQDQLIEVKVPVQGGYQDVPLTKLDDILENKYKSFIVTFIKERPKKKKGGGRGRRHERHQKANVSKKRRSRKTRMRR